MIAKWLSGISRHFYKITLPGDTCKQTCSDNSAVCSEQGIPNNDLWFYFAEQGTNKMFELS